MYGALTCGICRACSEGRDNLCENVAGIMGFHVDGFARELLNMPERLVIAVPEGVSARDAACAPIAFSTVQHMLFDNARLQPGETVLVHAGGSGIGTVAIMMAKQIGCTVITTVGDDSKIDGVKALGADHVINYRNDRFEHETRKITRKKGVDVVFEHVGADTFNGSLLTLKRGGRLVTCGSTSGPTTTINLMQLFQQQYRIFGSFGATMRNIAESLDKMAGGMLPVIDTEVPIEDVADRAQAHGKPAGVRQDRRVFLMSPPAAAHQARLRDADQAARRSRGRRLDDRHAARHPLFRSDQDRKPVRPHHPPDRTDAARAADRPRQSDRRLPGEIAGGDRHHPRRRVGQSRPRRRRVRPSRSHLGARSRRIPSTAASKSRSAPTNCLRSFGSTASRR